MAPEKKTSLSDGLDRLGKIVDQMNDASTSIEEAMKLYAEGIALSEDCIARIKSAEQTVEQGRQRIEGALEKDGQ